MYSEINDDKDKLEKKLTLAQNDFQQALDEVKRRNEQIQKLSDKLKEKQTFSNEDVEMRDTTRTD